MPGFATNKKTFWALGNLEAHPYLTMPVSLPASAHLLIFSTICSVNRKTNVIWSLLNFCAVCFIHLHCTDAGSTTKYQLFPEQHSQLPISYNMSPCLWILLGSAVSVFSFWKGLTNDTENPHCPAKTSNCCSGSGVVASFIPEGQKGSAPLRPQDRNFLNGKH